MKRPAFEYRAVPNRAIRVDLDAAGTINLAPSHAEAGDATRSSSRGIARFRPGSVSGDRRNGSSLLLFVKTGVAARAHNDFAVVARAL